MNLTIDEAQERIRNGDHLIIDMECGVQKFDGAFGIDLDDGPNVDSSADLEMDLLFLPDSSIYEFHSYHFLEHIQQFRLPLSEVNRNMNFGCRFIITILHFSNPYYYFDYTHKWFFGLYSFDYFSAEQSQIRGKRRAYISFLKKHNIKRFYYSSSYLQEVYEYPFSSKIHFCEIEFELSPIK